MSKSQKVKSMDTAGYRMYRSYSYERPLPGDNDVEVTTEIPHADIDMSEIVRGEDIEVSVSGDFNSRMTVEEAERLVESLKKIIKVAKNPPKTQVPERLRQHVHHILR